MVAYVYDSNHPLTIRTKVVPLLLKQVVRQKSSARIPKSVTHVRVQASAAFHCGEVEELVDSARKSRQAWPRWRTSAAESDKRWCSGQADVRAPQLEVGGHVFNAPNCTYSATQLATDRMWCVHLCNLRGVHLLL